MRMHFSVYSHTFTRSSDSLDLHIQIFVAINCWSGIWRGSHAFEKLGFHSSWL